MTAGRRNGTMAVMLVIAVSFATPSGTGAVQSISTKDLLGGLSNPNRWLTYSGDYSGRRHSPLVAISTTNVAQLKARWTFQTNVPGKLEASPIVADGVIYLTGPANHAWAIDARTGRQLWHYARRVPPDVSPCCGPVNRGFAIYRDRLLMATLDAHLIALDRHAGKILYDVPMADHSKGYTATVAPLVIRDKVIVGISGGEFGIRGFLDAYDIETGARAWRFWTIPAPNERGSETWEGDAWQRGGGPTWVTGTYDPEINLLFWGTGNPAPDFFGDKRRGDNLYTNCLIALDPDTGMLRWYFQFTPHDVHDWDANHVPVLADLTTSGEDHKVVMVANRNGYFYVLNRHTGALIRAAPFVKTTWRMLPNGRPDSDSMTNSGRGATCPDMYGATNFMSPSFDDKLNLFFVTAREACMVFFREDQEFVPGLRWMGGSTQPDGERVGVLRAIDALTGLQRWEFKHRIPSWAGVLSTASGVLFTGDGDGSLLALDSQTGRKLWQYVLGAAIYAAPITYSLDGRQYVMLPSGTTLTAFALD